MTKSEVIKLLGMIRVAYPAANMGEDKKMQIGLWHEMLAMMPLDAALVILKQHIATDAWPPSISAFLTAWTKANASNELTPSKAFQLAFHAASQLGGSKSKSELMEALPPIVQRTVELYGGLSRLAYETADEWQEKRFKEVYEEALGMQERETFQRMLAAPDLPALKAITQPGDGHHE